MKESNDCIEKKNIEREKVLMSLENDFINDFVKLRKELKLSQREMGEAGNVIRETVARIENQITSPQINTLIKILEPFGYTIKIKKIDYKD